MQGPWRAGMKLGVQLNSFDWTGGPERFGRNLARDNQQRGDPRGRRSLKPED